LIEDIIEDKVDEKEDETTNSDKENSSNIGWVIILIISFTLILSIIIVYLIKRKKTPKQTHLKNRY